MTYLDFVSGDRKMCPQKGTIFFIHYLSSLIHSVFSGSFDPIVTLKLFMQLSSAIHEQDSVHAISFFLQIHRAPLHADVLQLHVVSSTKPFGAES